MPAYESMPQNSAPQVGVDQLHVVVRLLESPAAPADFTEGVFCAWQGITASLEEATSSVRAVAWDNETEVFHNYSIEQRFTDFSWGASGTALTYMIEIANGVTIEAIVGGLAYAVGKIRGRNAVKNRPRSLPLIDVARGEVFDAIRSVFDVSAETLNIDRVESSDEIVHVTLSTSTGSEFEASVALLSSGDPFIHVRRTRK